MRTNLAENEQLGAVIADKLNHAQPGTAALLLPKKGLSGIDAPGQPFYGPAEDQKLFDTLHALVNAENIEVIDRDEHMNDPSFAEAAAQTLLDLIDAQTRAPLCAAPPRDDCQATSL